MATAMELAMQEAERRRREDEERHRALNRAVTSWSSDDTVHTDPPLQQPAAVAPQAPEPAPQPPAPPVMQAEAPSAPEPMENEMSNAATKPQLKLPNPAEVGVSEAAQMAVRDNPGTKRREMIAALVEAGYKETSLSALYGQMHTQGIIRCDSEGRMFARFKRYHPVMSYDTRRKIKAGHKPIHRKDRVPRAFGVDIDKVHVKRTKKPRKVWSDGTVLVSKPGAAPEYRYASHADAARYANSVRWAKVKGNPIPTWEEWARENIAVGLAKKGKLLPPPVDAPKAKAKATPKAAKQRSTVVELHRKKDGTPDKRFLSTQAANFRLDRGSAVRQTAPQAVHAVTPSSDVQGILDSITIAQAKALFIQLQKIFRD